MKKTWYILLTALSLGAPTLWAAEKEVQWSWETQLRSQYMGKIGLVFNDDPLMVNDFGGSYGDFFFGFWTSTALGGDTYGSTFGDEIDLYVGWGHTYDWIRFQVLASYFALKNLDNLRDDIWVVEPEISFPTVPWVQPYVAVRSFNQITSKSPEDGWFLWTGIRRSQPLGFKIGLEEETNLKLDFMAAYSDGALGRTPGWVFARITAALPIKATKSLTITPSVLFQTPIADHENAVSAYNRENEVVGAVSLRWIF